MEIKPYTLLSGICLGCAVVTGGFTIARNQISATANTARVEALRQIVNYRIANNCWEIIGDEPVMIGNSINLPAPGKSPTACFFDTNSQRYVFAGYLGGRLQALHIFTPTEIDKGVPND